jgi:HK97 family phage major capsid protein
MGELLNERVTPIPTYNSLTSRTDSGALIPEEVSDSMLATATEQSAVLSTFRRIPVARGQLRIPILSALPLAYWVAGDTGLKQTTEMAWGNKFLNIEEAATIMPVPDSVAEDIDANIWDEAMPYLVEAFGRLIDSAVFFGTNAPASFPTNINSAAAAAGNVVSVSTATTAANGGVMADIDNLYGVVEGDGFDVSGFVAARTMRSKLRTARDTTGQKLDTARIGGDLGSFDGLPVKYPMRGLFPTGGGAGTNPALFAGDFDQFVLGVRRDITVDVFREGIIQDGAGAIVYNLMQQDLTAIRLTFRLGWQVSNLINNDQPVEANRYPVGVLRY